MAEETLYEVLGVRADAELDEIKRAYRRRCREFHPDGLPDHREEILRFATERMKLITLAWDVLSDPIRRRDYDASLRSGGPRAQDRSGLQDEIERLQRELDAARRGAQAQGEGNEALLEELRRIRAFYRAQAEMGSRQAAARAATSGATGTPRNPYQAYLDEEEALEWLGREQRKSPEQRARARAERERKWEQWGAESRNPVWGFFWKRSPAVRKAEARLVKAERWFDRRRNLLLFPFRAVRLLLELTVKAIGVAMILAVIAGSFYVAHIFVEWIGL